MDGVGYRGPACDAAAYLVNCPDSPHIPPQALQLDSLGPSLTLPSPSALDVGVAFPQLWGQFQLQFFGPRRAGGCQLPVLQVYCL